MKKRIFSLLIITTVMIMAALSFSSCADNSFSSSGFTVSEISAPVLNYIVKNDTTAVKLYLKITNHTRVTLESLSFSAEFRDASGEILESRICRLDHSLAAGETKSVDYDFSSSDTSNFSTVRGRVASVTYSPCDMQFAGGTVASEITEGKEPLGVLEIVIIVIDSIACLVLIFFGISLTYMGVSNDYDEGIHYAAIGIGVIVVTVVFGISIAMLLQ